MSSPRLPYIGCAQATGGGGTQEVGNSTFEIFSVAGGVDSRKTHLCWLEDAAYLVSSSCWRFFARNISFISELRVICFVFHGLFSDQESVNYYKSLCAIVLKAPCQRDVKCKTSYGEISGRVCC